MTINDYQHLAARTINRLADNLVNGAMGLCGEAGEVTDLVKKIRFQGHSLEAHMGDLVEEIGDVAWYVALLCTVLGMDLEDVLAANIDKLRARYPAGFETERSVHR